ncbi:MAG: hypothetical protein OXU72_09640, partial [Gammaproteobacteria bacterium]|nr:hypothetical protein [Gammaproteobacteria bacterium]
SYIRTPGGFVTSMHDVAPSEGNTHRVPFFNPGSNTAQESLLRLVNPGDAEASVTIRGVDDRGAAAPGGAVTFTLAPHASRTLSAMDLEDGASGLNGSLGDGAGKWRLEVEADSAIMAVSMLSTPTGHLTNLSTDPGEAPADDRYPAPAIEVTEAREFSVTFKWSVQANETYAFDVPVRFDGGDWQDSCDELTATGTGEADVRFPFETGFDLAADGGTVIEARYRYRNGSSCTSGSPGDWSEIGRHTVSGGGGGTQAPDLVVESASVDDNSPDTGASFTLSATVRNRGDGAATSTTLRYYRSSNSTISASDTAVGTDSVVSLASSATSAESILLTAPSSAGTYYYGACVDAVSDESDTRNNCSDGAKVEVSDDRGGGGTDSYCRDDDDIDPGDRCDIYSTDFYVEVDGSGRGCLQAGGFVSCSDNRLSHRNTTINGVRITLLAASNADDSWTIDDVEPEPSD